MTDSPLPRRRALPSLLPRSLKRALGVALALAAFMVANAGFLLLNRVAEAVGLVPRDLDEIVLPKLFQVLVLTHTGVGLLLAAVMLVFLVAHLPRVWKRFHRASLLSGIFYVSAGLTLVLTGLLILTDAASRDNRWAWWLHVACAGLVITGYAVHRLVSYSPPARRARVRFLASAVALVLVFFVGNLATGRRPTGGAAEGQGGSPLQGTAAASPDAPGFRPLGFVSPSSPFFPSPATTGSGGLADASAITRDDVGPPAAVAREAAERGFAADVLIGAATCERCHQDIVDQWAASAHRFSSFNNPFYEATIDLLRERSGAPNVWVQEHLAAFPQVGTDIGRVKSKWCSGCHDPALLFSGRMPTDIDRSTPEAQAGLTCLACHAIDRIHNRTGNGNYNVADDQEDPYLFTDAEGGTVAAFLHDAALKAKPSAHKRLMLKPFFQEAEYCATCHKVSLDVPVNNYRWLRGQNEFDNWDDSGVALNASRTFYLPERRRICQDCHMPLEPAVGGDLAAKNGLVKSHRFLAANTALPFLRNDQETIERIETFLQDEKLSVDIFAVSVERGGRKTMGIDPAHPDLRAGDRVTLDVVVRNRGVGHTFPGGTNDSNEGWLQLVVRTADGDTLAVSGAVDERGYLDAMAHVYLSVLVDSLGRPVAMRNAQDARATVFANVIGPGTADVAHYEFVIPPSLDDRELIVEARLLWRKFNREYTEFSFSANPEGFKGFSEAPRLPITEIAKDRVALIVGARAARSARDAPADPAEWMRYNDYGIGLLLEGDTRGAAQAFTEVADLRPDLIEGPLNLAKTAVQDGNLMRAFEQLARCESIRPGDARVAWVWGVARQEEGRYPEAVAAYQRVLEVFPDDRAAWRNLGRTLYLSRRYEEALEAFARVLEIDPEDRVAHYHRMLSFRALGRVEEADVAAAAYAYYAIDESAQEYTRQLRSTRPGINLMAQAIRTHVLRLEP